MRKYRNSKFGEKKWKKKKKPCLIQRLWKDVEEFEEEHIGIAAETKGNV